MTLADLHHTMSAVVDRIGPAVVGITAGRGAGSGLVIARDRIVTNAHNLRGDRVEVHFGDGTRTEGNLLGADVDGDVAVLEAATGEREPLAFGGEIRPGIGLPVLALADPGGRGLRVTFGYVSGVDRVFRGPRGRVIPMAFEHTAPLLPGSSGGPVVDAGGNLLGMNTHRLGEGFYLAMPFDEALRARVDVLREGRSVVRPRLGIGIAPARVARRLRAAVGLPEVDGLLVRTVEDNSPAQRAGIREGDLVVALAGQPVSTVDALHAILDGSSGETTVDLVRGAEEKTVTVDFG